MTLRDELIEAFRAGEARRRSADYTGSLRRAVAHAPGGHSLERVRAELIRMERDGLVRRVKSLSDVNRICWERVQ